MHDHEQGGWAPVGVCDVGEDDSYGYVIGIRETDAPDSWSLLFMECQDADDPQAFMQGMDTYCLVVDPGQYTQYGGVKECELDSERIRLKLTEEAAKNLGMPVDTSIALLLTAEQVDLIRQGLVRVLTSGRPDALPQLRI
jgi:hypothetical protein